MRERLASLPAALAAAGSLLSVLLLAGCASSPPASFYTLTSTVALREPVVHAGQEWRVGVGPVHFPLFLDRPQLVSRDARQRLRFDEFHRWGGSLEDDFQRVWLENLSALLGPARVFGVPREGRYDLDVRVTAEILAFEGTPEGEAVLKVRWVVLDHRTQEVLRVEEGQYRRPLVGPQDEVALTAAMSATLGDFSLAVAETLRQLPGHRDFTR